MKYSEIKWSKVFVLITWTVLLSPLLAINPPNKGSFPPNFWEVMRDRGVGIIMGIRAGKRKSMIGQLQVTEIPSWNFMSRSC